MSDNIEGTEAQQQRHRKVMPWQAEAPNPGPVYVWPEWYVREQAEIAARAAKVTTSQASDGGEWRWVSAEAPDHEEPTALAGPRPDTTNPKDLIGITKPQVHLVPPALVLHVAQAMADGAEKYGPYNWRKKPVRATVYVSAALRHLYAYFDGEDSARDSGHHHLAHAAACIGILLDALETGNLVDDRPTAGPSGDIIERFTDELTGAERYLLGRLDDPEYRDAYDLEGAPVYLAPSEER